jgi:hypothetical protein
MCLLATIFIAAIIVGSVLATRSHNNEGKIYFSFVQVESE